MKFNEKLIILRKEKGLSQEEFGNILKVSRQSVSKWELGQAQPDVDKIKKICEFYNITFDYLLNDNVDEENKIELKKEDNTSKKTKNKLIIFLQIIIFIIFIAYTINTVFKAVVFSNILAKNDMDNIDAYKYNSISQKEYVYPYKSDKVLTNISVNEYVCYKNDIYYVWISYDDDDCIYYEQYWDYYNGRFDKKGYRINTKIKDGIWEQDYYYRDEGNFLRQLTTFKFINDEMKEEFSIANILNPFKFYKITDDGNIVIENTNENYKYSKHIYYIDIKTGFLSKEERISNEEIVEKTIYEGYEINCVEDKDLMFDENLKQEIIDKSKITMEKNLREAEILTSESLNRNESE